MNRAFALAVTFFGAAVAAYACGGTKTTTTTPVPSASVVPVATVPPSSDLDGGAGRIDPEAVRRVIRAGFSHFKLCYVTALKKTKGLSGRVETKFVIDETGHVISAEDVTRSNVLQDDDARSCIVSKFKQLEFPPPNPSGKVPVTYPLLFEPALALQDDATDGGADAASTDEYAHTRPPFNQASAATAIAAVSVKSCPHSALGGNGHIKLTFDPSGVVTKAEIDSPATLAKTPSGVCIAKAYAAVRVAVFDGSAVTVAKTFAIP